MDWFSGFVSEDEMRKTWHRGVYKLLIEKAQSAKRTRADGYFENHHIIPQSFGGTRKFDNMVLLTAREHFVAHTLLERMFTGKKYFQMANALNRLSSGGMKKGRIKSRQYEMAKRRFSEMLRVKPRDPCSEETKRKIGDANRGRTASDETRRLMSEARRGKGFGMKNWTWEGKKHSEETKRKISEAVKSRSREVIDRISAKQVGRKLSDETKTKISMAKIGKPGKPMSDETKAKIAAKARERAALRKLSL